MFFMRRYMDGKVLPSSCMSPASCGGTRAQLLLKSQTSPLTARLANGGARSARSSHS